MSTNKSVTAVKLVLLGEAAVGKSSLVLRFVSNDFQENKVNELQLEEFLVLTGNRDTAGQERFASLAPMYYRNAQAALVVYDITKPASFIKARHWVKELHEQASKDIIIALVGNKYDLVEENEEENRKVAYEEGKQLAEEEGLLFFETSAKSAFNVKEVFLAIGNKIPNPEDVANNETTRNDANRVDLNVNNDSPEANGYYARKELLSPRRLKWKSLTQEEQSLLPWFPEYLRVLEHCIKLNGEFTRNLATTVANDWGASSDPSQWAQCGYEDYDKVKYVLKQMLREWSEDGSEERDVSFTRIFQYLETKYPNVVERQHVKILIPGSGLGRLNFELVKRGFWCQGSFTDLYGPDDLSISDHYSKDENASEFRLQNANQFDIVITHFFMDTASNVIEYLKTLNHTIKQGGEWINFGPLLWHFEDADDVVEIIKQDGTKVPTPVKGLELTNQDFLELAQNWFEFKHHEKQIEVGYSSDPKGLGGWKYKCDYWIATKK
ncbi:unnamed protein product [Wickerhamomyces anomalus]